MKRKNIKLEWYAFEYDWNSKSLIRTNVLGDRFVENIQKKIKRDKIDNYESLKEAVKIDIWYQLEPNLDRIVEYIIRELDIKF